MQSGVGREWGVYDEPVPYVPPGELRARRAARTIGWSIVIVSLLAISWLGLRAGSEAMLGQCSPSWLTGTDPQVCINASITGQTIHISGTASLSDRTILEVWADEDGASPDQAGASTDTAEVAVFGGSFSRTLDLSGFQPGTVTAHARLQMSSRQPADVLARYGQMGERLVGPDAATRFDLGSPAPRVVEVTTAVDFPASQAFGRPLA